MELLKTFMLRIIVFITKTVTLLCFCKRLLNTDNKACKVKKVIEPL